MVFRRKKIEKPKSLLGLALYKFDNIFNARIKNIITLLKASKSLNPKKTDRILKDAFYEMDIILDDISRDNFKTDYHSDKIRDKIENIIGLLKDNLTYAKSMSYDYNKLKDTAILKEIDIVAQLRQEIKTKMKDLESDYI